MRRPFFIAVLLLSATIVYVELRLPESVIAQGLDAVYRRLAVTDTSATAIRVMGGSQRW